MGTNAAGMGWGRGQAAWGRVGMGRNLYVRGGDGDKMLFPCHSLFLGPAIGKRPHTVQKYATRRRRFAPGVTSDRLQASDPSYNTKHSNFLKWPA
jgi:hypothetical protein